MARRRYRPRTRMNDAAPGDTTICLRISKRELATILAALRFHQDENLQDAAGMPDKVAKQIASNGGLFEPLRFDEVNHLCRRLISSENVPTPPSKGPVPGDRPGTHLTRKDVVIMAWRPTSYLIEGELDNTQPGKVTGWLQFVRMKDKVVLDLAGDFHRDIRGTRVLLTGTGCPDGAAFMQGFACLQTGKVGDMTAGLPPRDFVYSPYFEWYSEQNGRILLTPEHRQMKIIGKPIPAAQCQPISCDAQDLLFAEFLREYDHIQADRLLGKHVAKWIA